MAKARIAIIGAGKVGAALGIALQRAGYSIGGVLSRGAAGAEALARRLGSHVFNDMTALAEAAEVLLIAVPDRAIADVARRLADSDALGRDHCVLHVCGSQSAAVLACVGATGAAAGSLHPLQSFAAAETAAEKLRGAYFAIDGDARAAAIAREIVAALGGHVLSIPPERRALYHAAACMASNYTAALVCCAARLLQSLGVAERDAELALTPLVQGTLENLREQGALRALTGPIARGDTMTLEHHLAALTELPEPVDAVYRSMGLYTLELARQRQSVDGAQLEAIRRVLRRDGGAPNSTNKNKSSHEEE